MRIIPSIDIMNSKRVEVVSHVVEKTLEDSDPVETALFWEKKDVCMVHLVDIDAALNTGRSNADIIKRIIRSVRIPVQVAGGIRSRSQVEDLLSTGASRIVVRLRPCSTDTVSDFSGLENIVLGIDYLGENMLRDLGGKRVRVSGEEAVSWIYRVDDSIGLNGVLLTDVGREGSLTGLRGETLAFLTIIGETGLELMYAGGVAFLEDVSALKKTGVDGIIVGKALYNGLLRLDDLRRVAED